MFTKEQVIGAIGRVVERGSIPMRESAAARPTFWSKPMVYTMTRPIPAGSGWIDYIVLQGGRSFFPAGYSALVNRFVATGKDDMSVSGLRYRFLYDDTLMAAQEFNLVAGIDLNVERAAAIPWPSQHRRCHFIVENQHYFSLQVNNTGVVDTVAVAGLFGWFYPNLGELGREGFEATGFKQEDSVRG